MKTSLEGYCTKLEVYSGKDIDGLIVLLVKTSADG